MGALARAWWPGNVRQLEHALERAVLLAGPFPETSRSKQPQRLDDRDLVQLDPPNFTPPPGFGDRPPKGASTETPHHSEREGADRRGHREAPGAERGVSLEIGLRWLEELAGGTVSLKAALEGPELKGEDPLNGAWGRRLILKSNAPIMH
ncbi:MAG: hypothetical protein AAGG01_17950, partial [Planctomycetota bacterium]